MSVTTKIWLLLAQYILAQNSYCIDPYCEFFSKLHVHVLYIFFIVRHYIYITYSYYLLKWFYMFLFDNLLYMLIEPQHEISNNVICTTSKASDQPAHMHSLIRACASRLNIL